MGHKKRRKRTKTEKAASALSKGLRRLEPEQGMVARRNARQAVLKALKALRKAVDDEYPVIRKKPARTGPLSKAARTRKMRAQGYEAVYGLGDGGKILELKAAGIPTKERGLTTWIPGWADELWSDLAKLPRSSRVTILEMAAKRGHTRTKARALGIVAAATGPQQFQSLLGRARYQIERDITTAQAIIAASEVSNAAVRKLVEDLS